MSLFPIVAGYQPGYQPYAGSGGARGRGRALTYRLTRSAAWQERAGLQSAAADGDSASLPPFSEAMRRGIVVNKDDDYHMDTHEDLRELEHSLMDTVPFAAPPPSLLISYQDCHLLSCSPS